MLEFEQYVFNEYKAMTNDSMMEDYIREVVSRVVREELKFVKEFVI